MPVDPIPEGYRSITPYLIVKRAGEAIDFYKSAFAATELLRMEGPPGRIGHAEIKIGDSIVMLADEHPDHGSLGPESIGGSPIHLMLYVEDVDAVFARAVAGGATVVRPLKDQFYGDRNGMLKDPFGHNWTLATHIEDVPPDELMRRAQAGPPENA